MSRAGAGRGAPEATDARALGRRLAEAGKGATALEAWSIQTTASRRAGLGVKDREIGGPATPLSVAEGRAARYRLIWADGRVSRGTFERAQLDAPPARLLEFARAGAYDDPDAAVVHGPADYPDVDLHAPDAAAAAAGAVDAFALRLQRARACVEAIGARTWSGSFAATEAGSHLATSVGLDVEGRGTSFGWHVTLDGEAGDGFGGRAPDGADEVEARLDRLGRLAEDLRRPAATVEAGTATVLLDPGVVDRYALDTLLHHLSGSSVAMGESRFSADDFRRGRRIFPERLGLALDPLRPLGSGSYRYTPEGVPAARCTYIEAGRLVRPLLDLKFARRLAMEPTPLPYDADALEWTCGPRLSWEEALAAPRLVRVVSVLGIHTQDASSGDFSLSAPQALAYADGRCAGRLRGTIGGNLFDVLSDPELALVDVPGERVPAMRFPCRFDPRDAS